MGDTVEDIVDIVGSVPMSARHTEGMGRMGTERSSRLSVIPLDRCVPQLRAENERTQWKRMKGNV